MRRFALLLTVVALVSAARGTAAADDDVPPDEGLSEFPVTCNGVTDDSLPNAFRVEHEGTVIWYRNSPLSGVQQVTAGSDDFGYGLKELASSQTPVFTRSEVSAVLGAAGADEGGASMLGDSDIEN